MRTIATAVAVLALVTSAAHAQGNGKGNGGGGGHGNGGEAGASMHAGGGGNGHGNGNRGGGEQAMGAPDQGGGSKDRGNSRTQGAHARAEHGNSSHEAGRGNGAAHAVLNDRGQGNERADHRRYNDNRVVVIDDRGRGRDVVEHDVVRVRDFAAIPPHRLVTGCPPGLAKKNPPCVPPGHVRSAFRDYDRPDFWGLRLDDGRYRYNDGYLIRLNPDGRIGGYVPLLGGALAIGNLWPASYQPVALPNYYESYYGLGPYDSYRYADNVIYQVDPKTAAITSIAALLTGDTFAVGQPMPLGYDVYNVPYAYRDQYYDTPDAYYRYSDGYVYQVDPKTQLIAAAIQLLAS